MSLSIFMHCSRRLPAVNNLASKLLSTQVSKSNLILTPIVARKFSGLNRSHQEPKKSLVSSIEISQTRLLSHSAIWTAEKMMSVALLATIPACLAFPNALTDNIMAISVVLHMHWGVEAVVVDYVRPALVGNVIPQIAKGIVYLISAITLGGLIYFNFNDIGCGRAVRRLWAIKS